MNSITHLNGSRVSGKISNLFFPEFRLQSQCHHKIYVWVKGG